MPTVDVVNLDNQVVGQLDLSEEVFGAEVNEHLLYEAVRNYQAGLRRGTHQTKERGSVSGSGKKLWRQKGTGRARMGSIRSPLWRHGGTVHGPQPRDYSYKLPRKMLLGALRSALSAKLRDGELLVVKEFHLPSHKTKEFRQALGRLGVTKSVLLVSNGENPNLERSSRNLPKVSLLASREVHPFHLLEHQRVILSETTAQKLSEALR
jgi:large subunit ribosomal protein L4